MTKRELKKEAYKRIIKQQQSHQQVFDDLKNAKSLAQDEIAHEIAKIPSPKKIAENRFLRQLFIASLALIALLRILTLLTLPVMNANISILLLIIVLSFIVPVIGIVLMIQHRLEGLRVIGIIFIIGIFRSLKGFQEFDPWMLLGLVPALVAIILVFLLPERMKTTFTRKTVDVEKDGQIIRQTEYVFENGRVTGSDLLDAGIQ